MLTSAVASVLIVDDDPSIGRILKTALRQGGIRSTYVRSAKEALDVLARAPIDVVLTDLHMDGMNGMELLLQVRARWSDVPVVMMTGHGTINIAVEAMKNGALDFLTKPFDTEQIFSIVRRAIAVVEARPDAPPPPEAFGDHGFVGASESMKRVKDLLVLAGQGQGTVLLHGESGTGKELAAKLVHRSSPRASGPFVTLNCAALTESLFTAELFGHERGAFTGAVARTPGRVELAQGGTLFLDEVAEIPIEMQAKLLRVLQEREFERVMGSEKIKADVRFVAATHRSLPELVARKEFREDLFYRLNVLPVVIPPLRARPEDIEPLALHFCALVSEANKRRGVSLEPDALDALRQHSWPGNVRELQHFIERLVMLSATPRLGRRDVEREFERVPVLDVGRSIPPPTIPPAPLAPSFAPLPVMSAAPQANGGGKILDDRRKGVERETLLEALEKTDNNRAQAARLLGISRRTLYNKLELYGIE
ncbi:MAG: sigma-54 dependent transcriptional regulator [Polyangiales bacterium]